MHLFAGAPLRADQGQEIAHVVTKNKHGLRGVGHLGCSYKFLAEIHDGYLRALRASEHYSTALKELLARLG